MTAFRLVSLAWICLAMTVAGCGDSTGDTGGTGGTGATGGTAGTGGAGATGGTGAAGGAGATGGAGGIGGGSGGAGGMSSCTDDVGARPTLTAQPTITPMDGVEGGQVEVGVAVSAEARLVRVSFFDGFGDPGGEATMATTGSESLTLTVDLTGDATAFDYFLGINLCDADNTDCIGNSGASSVSYIRGTSTAQPGEPYFVSVRDDGASIPALSTESCFDLLAIKIAAP